ncbi:tyrosine-type recombinase/integrase [Undibacterium sp. Rencai35W]|uniref:tyrosine-type recombinase/integrase n=1 Tax=Undibacterium sp. Rencai35W TaxID=3413046 RepID=UPI003BF1AE3D
MPTIHSARGSPYIFTSERGAPLSTDGFRKTLARLEKKAGFELRIHPHMLRHGCGFKLANDGVDTRVIQDYLGHKNIQHTVAYTKLSMDRFDGLWKG